MHFTRHVHWRICCTVICAAIYSITYSYLTKWTSLTFSIIRVTSLKWEPRGYQLLPIVAAHFQHVFAICWPKTVKSAVIWSDSVSFPKYHINGMYRFKQYTHNVRYSTFLAKETTTNEIRDCKMCQGHTNFGECWLQWIVLNEWNTY